MQTLIGSSQFLSAAATGAVLACILALAVVWYLTDSSKEMPWQERLKSHLTVYMVPLLMVFAYIVIIRVIRIVQ